MIVFLKFVTYVINDSYNKMFANVACNEMETSQNFSQVFCNKKSKALQATANKTLKCKLKFLNIPGYSV